MISDKHYIDEGFMIVPERKVCKVAMEIKHHVSIHIHKVVSFALLGVNESLDLHHHR